MTEREKLFREYSAYMSGSDVFKLDMFERICQAARRTVSDAQAECAHKFVPYYEGVQLCEKCKTTQAECGKSSGEAVGEITHSSFEGWYFHPYINWPEIGDGTKLYAAPQHSTDTAGANPVLSTEVCAQDVFEKGQSIGLFDIPKHTANEICAGISAATGARVDWHYIGGRVHMKALAATPASSADIDAMRLDFAQAYLAFKGAFDTPQMRMKIKGEYADDARRRMREFADRFSAPAMRLEPTEAQAEAMGEKGAPHSEHERKLYEAYCKGHCWAVGKWNAEKGYYMDMIDRIRFAMWRDRAALGIAAIDAALQAKGV
ncbi:hypothetical protein, partial [Caballeronia glathei]